MIILQQKPYSNWKVVTKDGVVVAFGPNNDDYIPTIKEGENLIIMPNQPNLGDII